MKIVNVLILFALFTSLQSFAASTQYCGIKVENVSIAKPSANMDNVIESLETNLLRSDAEIKSFKTCSLDKGQKVIVMMGDKLPTSALIFPKKKNTVEINYRTGDILLDEIADIYLIQKPLVLNCNPASESCLLGSKNIENSQWIAIDGLYEDLNAQGLSMPGLFEVVCDNQCIVKKL